MCLSMSFSCAARLEMQVGSVRAIDTLALLQRRAALPRACFAPEVRYIDMTKSDYARPRLTHC